MTPVIPVVPVFPEAPIYAELVRRWRAEGRSVPGQPDQDREPPPAPPGAQPMASGSGSAGTDRNPGGGSVWIPGPSPG